MAIGRTKQYNSKEFARILLDNGFEYVGCKGSHKHYRRDNELVILPVNNCNKMLSRRLLKEHNLKFKK